MEAAREGGRVDVLARKGVESVGIEVETGKSDAVKNVGSCLRAGYSLVLVVATSEAAKEKVMGQLEQQGLLVEGKVVVVLRDEYAPETPASPWP